MHCISKSGHIKHDLRIFKTRFKYDLSKFYFSNSLVVDACNSLPNWIVMANNTNTFKRRLDTDRPTYWQDQEGARPVKAVIMSLALDY